MKFRSSQRTTAFVAMIVFSQFTGKTNADPATDNPPHFPAQAAQLKSAYERDVEKAAAPIRESYIWDLKQLLKEEIDQNNTAEADAIKAELDNLPGGAAITGDTIPAFESKLVGIGWVWNRVQHVSFSYHGASQGYALTWKTVEPYTIKYETKDGAHGTITFDRDLQQGMAKETTPAGLQKSFQLTRLPPDRAF